MLGKNKGKSSHFYTYTHTRIYHQQITLNKLVKGILRWKENDPIGSIEIQKGEKCNQKG